MGLGRKVFTAGEILAASEVQGFLMDQSVMVFADAAERTAAIPSPEAGMHTFLTDTDSIEVFDGSSFVNANSLGGSIAATNVAGTLTAANINASRVISTLTSLAGTTHSFAASDQGQLLRFTAAGTVTATIGTATALSSGQRIDVLADGAAGVLINAGSSVTLAGGGTAASSYLLEQYDAATILSLGSNEYRIIGNITAI
jgi:hypothetical protein